MTKGSSNANYNSNTSNTKEAPKRRHHRKSRYGCRNCKSRRHKCDEAKPTCNNCAKSSLSCEYILLPSTSNPCSSVKKALPLPPPTVTQHVSVLKETSLIPNTPMNLSYPSTIASFADNPDSHSLDVHLFHHYTTLVNHTSDRYSHFAIGMACTNSSIMDALLGVAAFSLRKAYHPPSSISISCPAPSPFEQRLIKASHHYMSRAISAHRNLITTEGVTPENSDLVLAASLFITIHATGSARFLSASYPSLEKRIPIHWFRQLKGLKEMIAHAGMYVRDQTIKSCLEWEKQSFSLLIPPLLPSPAPPPICPPVSNPSHSFSFLLDDLEDGSPNYDLYTRTVSLLGIFNRKETIRYAMKFPSLVGKEFVALVEESDERALAIVGYFLMLVKRISEKTGIWWLQGVAEGDFDDVMAVLGKAWWGKMEWAAREIGWNGMGEKVHCGTGEGHVMENI
ncbi:hypothetical protein ACMFMG_010458 [Clarireedia jacksonii]